MPRHITDMTAKRVPGTKKSLKKSVNAKKNPALKKWAHAATKAWAAYKANQIPGLHYTAGRPAGKVWADAKYKAYKRTLIQ
jgi:hypothetical protein